MSARSNPGFLRPFILLAAVALMATVAAPSVRADDASTDPPAEADGNRIFAVHVLPLMKQKCFACHGNTPDDLKGELDLTSREALLEGGESGEPTVVPGKPDAGLLLSAIRWEDYEMPPKENDRLTDEQIEWFEKWVAAGAPWPNAETIARLQQQAWASDTSGGMVVRTSGGLSDEWTHRRYDPTDVWAFLPVPSQEEIAVPEGADHPIDAFLNARIAEAGLEPAGTADPVTLIRRATYDLIGLPPTPEETDAFVAAWQQDADRAWLELIDRLLASPHYGERWAQHWLDVVRYADTSGFSNDWERSNAWRYRDYVIRSFNADKPYNRFIMEQVAGDELDPDDPEMLVAVGFLRMGPWEHTPMNPNKESRQQYLDDVVNGIGQTFLSTAMRCAKCHDHKFDPLPTRDYYRLYAALATTQLAERPAPFLPEENRNGFDEGRQHVERLLAFAKSEQDKLYAKREAAAKKWYADHGRPDDYVPYEVRLKQRNVEKPPRFVGLSTEEQGTLKVREQDVRIWTRRLERFQPLAQSVYYGGDLYQKSIRLRMPDPNKGWEMKKAQAMPETAIYAGGSVFAPAEPVTPGVLSGLGIPVSTEGASAGDPYALPQTMEGRRLALARWIADEKNPLTTRSIANRIWHYHFGRGIAANPNNFGATGKKPTHPELLDWLANEFVARGWSIKQMHRLIMTSQAYRRSTAHPDPDALAEKDPTQDLLAAFRPRRLTAEELRDSMLFLTGELQSEMGGLPARPEMNMEVALAPRMIQFSLAPAWQPSRTPARRNRRSIYAYRVRGLPDPLMNVFNQPGSDESCEMRDAPSVTPQVFTLMNSDVITKRSVAMAVRLEEEAESPAEQIARGYRLITGKPLDASLQQTLVTHYEKMTGYHREHTPERPVYPTKVTRSLVEEFSGDPFEYEEMLDMYEDYVPDVHASDVSPETRALADVCLLLLNSNAFMYVY
ncbi:DUF1549 domain-containing protein [Maioricimonas sp. JC845]|uniref:PSD1 and planctomycete cytochrome C domain-containing protein n=1 Tax=Maioricimonas sp. JC845 TaxID=3232138 RepID=UPI003457621F